MQAKGKCMQYRRLSNEELRDLEKEFTRFLAVNHVTADDWVRLKEKEMDKAEELISIFSDIIFNKTLKKLEYLEFKTPYDIKTFHCDKEKIVLMGIAVDKNAGIDFTKNESPEQMMKILKESGKNIQIYTAEKKYSDSREKELFQMLENGCLISRDGHLYKTLHQLKQ